MVTDPGEYFLARGEAPGRWYGRGLPELGLARDAMGGRPTRNQP